MPSAFANRWIDDDCALHTVILSPYYYTLYSLGKRDQSTERFRSSTTTLSRTRRERLIIRIFCLAAMRLETYESPGQTKKNVQGSLLSSSKMTSTMTYSSFNTCHKTVEAFQACKVQNPPNWHIHKLQISFLKGPFNM